ncbi:hypothetical protein L1887_11266 [Cichorium endivia]|nr:hypothetical protein L1887_11266 [Cichorium endivia]
MINTIFSQTFWLERTYDLPKNCYANAKAVAIQLIRTHRMRHLRELSTTGLSAGLVSKGYLSPTSFLRPLASFFNSSINVIYRYFGIPLSL